MKLKKSRTYRLTIKIRKHDNGCCYKFSNSLLLPEWFKEELAYTLDKFLNSTKNG